MHSALEEPKKRKKKKKKSKGRKQREMCVVQCASQQVVMMKYKTDLCKNWLERGYCHYGTKCKYAHGKEDLQARESTHNKFRTKRCPDFNTVGCQFGIRCNYIHQIVNEVPFYSLLLIFDISQGDVSVSIY